MRKSALFVAFCLALSSLPATLAAQTPVKRKPHAVGTQAKKAPKAKKPKKGKRGKQKPPKRAN